jgi:hypothetical protein
MRHEMLRNLRQNHLPVMKDVKRPEPMGKCINSHRLLRGNYSCRGFTLIQAATLLFVGGLMMTSVLEVAKIERGRQVLDVNQERMATIKKAIKGYVAKFNSLPCPADPALSPASAQYGKMIAACLNPGDETGAVISTKEPGPPGWVFVGALPVRDLALPREYMKDSWGHLFTYAMTGKLSSPPFGQPAGTSMDAAIIADPTLPTIHITSPSGTFIDPNTSLPLDVTNALYVLVSHGPDARGAYTPEGQQLTAGPFACGGAAAGYDFQNCNHNNGANAVFVQENFSTRTGVIQHFDDTITWATTISDIALPICDPTETLYSPDGTSFACKNLADLPVCQPGEVLTSTDGITFSCMAAAMGPLPVCDPGDGLMAGPEGTFACTTPPGDGTVPPKVPSCGVNQALTSNGTDYICKTLNFANMRERIEDFPGSPNAGWFNSTPTCPAGTIVLGGSWNAGWYYIAGRNYNNPIGGNTMKCNYYFLKPVGGGNHGGDCRALCGTIK